MPFITVKISKELNEKLERLKNLKGFETKSEIIRQALREFIEANLGTVETETREQGVEEKETEIILQGSTAKVEKQALPRKKVIKRIDEVLERLGK